MANKLTSDLPRNAGELRRLISANKYPWTVDPRLRDGDPLPQHARGGKSEGTLPHDTTLVTNVAEYLRGRQPPCNPFLRERWIELKMLKPQNRALPVASPPHVAAGTKGKGKTKQTAKRRKR